ncbi:MAG: TetR/AcrR family transcriptional regulator [Methanomassiliicoccus sp.]|nr:TetR/AcrR family transcriptional regulator [Methanomassiliicoccus sp.]
MSKDVRSPQDRKNEFIEAAEALFNEKGYENTSIDDIVARMGVAKGLFYYYFNSKEDLLDILFDRLVGKLESTITAAVHKEGLTAVERLNELLSTDRDIACRSSTLIAYFRKERNQALHLTMEDRAMTFTNGIMEEIIRQGMEEGVFHVDHPRETAIGLVGMIRGLVRSFAEERTEERTEEIAEIVQGLVERVLGMTPGTFVIRRALPR